MGLVDPKSRAELYHLLIYPPFPAPVRGANFEYLNLLVDNIVAIGNKEALQSLLWRVVRSENNSLIDKILTNGMYRPDPNGGFHFHVRLSLAMHRWRRVPYTALVANVHATLQ